MRLRTMQPNPSWGAAAYRDALEVLGGDDEYVFRVWGGDWCKDCRNQLPDFAAALDAAGVPEERIHHYPVEREDGEKVGEAVEEYGVEYIPTVVVERVPSEKAPEGDTRAARGEELVRFVEEEPVPISVHLAEQLGERDGD